MLLCECYGTVSSEQRIIARQCSAVQYSATRPDILIFMFDQNGLCACTVHECEVGNDVSNLVTERQCTEKPAGAISAAAVPIVVGSCYTTTTYLIILCAYCP